MDDRQQGPGWWQASDGRWYPPHDHPDAEHRLRYAVPSPAHAPASPVLPDADRSGPAAALYPHVAPVPPSSMPPEQWPAATRLRVAPDPMAAFDRAVVALAFLASLVLIVGSFLPWVRFDGAVVGEASAWDRHSAWANDGLLVMIAGVVGATASGALLAGGRSLFAKLCMLAAGLGAFAVFLVDVIDTGRENKAQPTVDIETGIGLWLVGVAAVVLVAAALLERSPWRWKADGP